MEPAHNAESVAGECDTCGEEAADHDHCPKSHRLCHHHCNCIWTQDTCHWCGAWINEDGELIDGSEFEETNGLLGPSNASKLVRPPDHSDGKECNDNDG